MEALPISTPNPRPPSLRLTKRLPSASAMSSVNWRGTHAVFDYGANEGAFGSHLNSLGLAAIRERIETVTGVRLRDVLEHVGLRDDAVYVAYYGADTHISGDADKVPISRGVPIAKALEDESLLAWGRGIEEALNDE